MTLVQAITILQPFAVAAICFGLGIVICVCSFDQVMGARLVGGFQHGCCRADSPMADTDGEDYQAFVKGKTDIMDYEPLKATTGVKKHQKSTAGNKQCFR